MKRIREMTQSRKRIGELTKSRKRKKKESGKTQICPQKSETKKKEYSFFFVSDFCGQIWVFPDSFFFRFLDFVNSPIRFLDCVISRIRFIFVVSISSVYEFVSFSFAPLRHLSNSFVFLSPLSGVVTIRSVSFCSISPFAAVVWTRADPIPPEGSATYVVAL